MDHMLEHKKLNNEVHELPNTSINMSVASPRNVSRVPEVPLTLTYTVKQDLEGLENELPLFLQFKDGSHFASSLRIMVPDDNKNISHNYNERSPLGEPIHFGSSPSSSSSMSSSFSPMRANFDKITLFPTPLIGSGSFGSVGSFRKDLPDILDIVKQRSPKHGHHDDLRVISEYKPGRKNSTLGKRFISNPIKLSPPSDDIEENVRPDINTDRRFYSNVLDKEFEFVEEIGAGNFSKVALAASPDGDFVAVKIITIPNSDFSNFKSYIRREVKILHEIHHPSIVKLIDYEISFDLEKGYEKTDFHEVPQLIFLNYCPGGNLFQFALLFTPNNWTNINYWYTIRRIVGELILAVAYLHSHQVIHRDIKLENVLLTHKYHELVNLALSDSPEPLVNLTDFGISKKLSSPSQMLSTRCGSQDYIAPELLMGLEYNGKLTDSWAVGVLIYAILEDRLPFDIPPASFTPHGVSPSVIRRKRVKHNTAHRIAMIDWDWYTLVDNLNNESTESGIREILTDLKEIVESLLVRKDKRKTVGDFVQRVSLWVAYAR